MRLRCAAAFTTTSGTVAWARWAGRVQPHQAALLALQRSQRGRQQAQFAQAGVRKQQFSQRAHGPAATGQLGVQRGVAAGTDGLLRAPELMCAPQRGVQVFRRGDKRRFFRRCQGKKIGRRQSR